MEYNQQTRDKGRVDVIENGQQVRQHDWLHWLPGPGDVRSSQGTVPWRAWRYGGAGPCMVTGTTRECPAFLCLMAGRFILSIHRGLRQPITSLQ